MSEARNDGVDDDKRLDALVRRMTEEVQGQVDADELAARARADPKGASILPDDFMHSSPSRPVQPDIPSWAEGAAADPDAGPRPPPVGASPSSPSLALGSKTASASSRKLKAPQSLPALLHLTARLVGGVMDRGVRAATGAHAQLGEPVVRGTGEGSGAASGEAEELRLRTRTVEDGRLEEVWVRASTSACFPFLSLPLPPCSSSR